MKIGKKWMRMAEIYRRFASDFPNADFSDEAAMAMYRHETFGEPMTGRRNGFEIGKKRMDVTIEMWKEDIGNGQLFVSDLDYPEWFLRRVGVMGMPDNLDVARLYCAAKRGEQP